MRAWVISIVSFDALKPHDYENISEVALAIVSARRKISFVIDCVTIIKTILLTPLFKQAEMSQYNHPFINTEIYNDFGCQISWFHHPFQIIAQRSHVIDVDEINGWPWLRWRGVEYYRFLESPVTRQFETKEKVEPRLKFAPQAKFGVNSESMFAKTTYESPWR